MCQQITDVAGTDCVLQRTYDITSLHKCLPVVNKKNKSNVTFWEQVQLHLKMTADNDFANFKVCTVQ